MPGRIRATGKEDSNREVMRRPGNMPAGMFPGACPQALAPRAKSARRRRARESYFLRQVTPSPSDGAFFMPGRARATGKEDSNREVMRRPGNPHCGHAKAPSSGAFASSSHYSTLTRVSAESVPRGHAFAARQPRRTRWALRPTRPRRAACAADRACSCRSTPRHLLG